MKRGHRILVAAVGVVLAGAAASEHVYRRLIEQRYRRVVESRRQLELQFGEMLAKNHQLERNLQGEQQRSEELSGALASIRSRLEEAVGRLANEMREVRELQMRLATKDQEAGQLQGELSMALQDRQAIAKSKTVPVQLDRIVVSNAGTPGLQGRVLSVHRDWNFVVLDLGWSAVRVGDTVSIFRNNQLLAKVRIERVQEGVCAATVLPEWETAQIEVNDLVRIL